MPDNVTTFKPIKLDGDINADLSISLTRIQWKRLGDAALQVHHALVRSANRHNCRPNEQAMIMTDAHRLAEALDHLVNRLKGKA